MSYHPSSSQLHIYPGKSDMSSKDNIPVTSSQYFPSELDKVEDPNTPTSVPTSFEESRKYKYPSVSSDHVSSGEDEGESKPDSFGLQSSMAHLNLTNTDPHSSESVHSSSQNPKSSDVESGSSIMIPRGGRTQHSNPQPSQGIDVNDLHARIQHLEAELERSRRPSNHSGELGGVSYQPNFPSQFYGSSPHHMEPIGRSNFSGPIPLQYSPNHTGVLPSMHTEGGYYHPCKCLHVHVCIELCNFMDYNNLLLPTKQIVLIPMIHLFCIIQYMSMKYSNSNYCQYSTVITVSLLWCSINKYTNYCQNYC